MALHKKTIRIKKVVIPNVVIAIFLSVQILAAEKALDVYSFSIPETTLDEAVSRLAIQAEHSALVSWSDVKRVRSNAVNGVYTVHEALDYALSGTGFFARVSEDKVITLHSIENKNNSSEEESMQSDKRKNSKRFKSKKECLRKAIGAIAASACLSGVYAQDEGFSGLEEVIVTSQKREESVQDVPATINVTSGEFIEQFFVTDASDLEVLAPGLTIKLVGDSIGTATIRGVGTAAGSQSFDQSVSFFQDGIYAGRSTGFSSGFFDIERIEVLKGPQSTLLGKNTSLGAVSVFTKNPTEDFEASVLVGYEAEYEGGMIQGAVSGPIGDNVQARLAVNRSRQGGWIENLATDNDIPISDQIGARLKIFAQPSDGVDLAFVYEYSDTEMEGRSGSQLLTNFGGFLDDIPGAGDVDSRTNNTGLPGEENFAEITTDRMAFTADFAVGEGVITSQTTYTDHAFVTDRDVDGYAALAPFIDVVLNEQDYEQITQEIRYTSPADDKFNYIVGAFYLKSEDTINETDLDGTDVAVVNRPSLLLSIPSLFSQDTDTLALFGSFEYAISDVLTLNAGIRYTDEEREANHSFAGADFVRQKRGDPVVDGNISLEYAFSNEVKGYAAFGQGTKSGGFSEAAAPGLNEVDDETATNYEVGIKSTLFDNRATLNASLFHTDIDDFQFTQFVGQFITSNIQAETQGFELEVNAYLNDQIKVYGNVVYAEAIDTETDEPLERAPEWDGLVGTTWSTNVGSGLQFTWDTSVSYTSKLWHDPPESGNARVVDAFGKEITRLNMRLAIEDSDGNWELALVGRNLTDEQNISFAFPAICSFNCLPPEVGGQISEGRTVMLQARYQL